MRAHATIGAVLALVLGACAAPPPDRPAARPALSGDALRQSLPGNLATLENVHSHLEPLEQEYRGLLERGGWQARGYFSAPETDALEFLLFRSVALQTTLWDMVESYGGLDAQAATDATHARAHILSLEAALQLSSHTAFVVQSFAGDPVAIGQANQAYYRSELFEGTYDRMRDNVTAPDLLGNTKQAGVLYRQESGDPSSALMRVAAEDPAYGALVSRLPQLLSQTEERLGAVATLLPSHAKAESIARADVRGQHENLYAIRSLVFKDVSRVKSPTAHLIAFSAAQKEQVFGLLEPGDLILTYTAGYVSDVFIPGAFKHGITYVGTPAEREAAGLSAAVPTDVGAYEPEKVAANLEVAALPDGRRANMIEAVAEGVIFNDLAHIMDTHVNRMVVLRPQLSDKERAEFLVEVFSYLGDGYDFRFDFSNASMQVCTEVIYRALDGKGAFDFRLTERAGHPTLSADDIANDSLSTTPNAYRFVLYAEQDPAARNHEAVVLVGDDGWKRLGALMAEQKGVPVQGAQAR